MSTLTDEMLSTRQVAELLGVTDSRVLQLATAGHLEQIVLSPRVRVYRRSDVEELAAARSAGAEIEREAVRAGAPAEVAQKLGARTEKAQNHRRRRARFHELDERARRRAAGLQRQLAEIARERQTVAAELAALDAQHAAVTAILERLNEELAIIEPTRREPPLE